MMAPAASAVQATEITAPAEAIRMGRGFRAGRAGRRLPLFNDYALGLARLFHAWRP